MDVKDLKSPLELLSTELAELKSHFYKMLLDKTDLNYFGKVRAKAPIAVTPAAEKTVKKSRFQHSLDVRLALSAYIVEKLHGDPNFGRTKFAKVFYFADRVSKLDLQTQYKREAAGPLDQRAFYNEKTGIEAQAEKLGYFGTEKKALKNKNGGIIRYKPGKNLQVAAGSLSSFLSNDAAKNEIDRIINLLRPLDTDQTEIVSTLYACWNDLLLDSRDRVADSAIIEELLTNWHDRKKRFTKDRLQKALDWMKKNKLVPSGTGKRTERKPDF